jgi:MFS family permease
LGAAILGVGLGSEADVAPYLLARYFGRRHFSVLYGLTWTAYAIGGATGPLWIGHMYDRANAYMPRFIVYLAAVAFGAVILSLFLPADQKGIKSKQEMSANASVPLEG